MRGNCSAQGKRADFIGGGLIRSVGGWAAAKALRTHGGFPWDKFQGQVLLAEEGFVEKFKDLLESKKQVKEIPRPQRYVSRPSLDKIFNGQKAKAQRDISISTAHISHGYTLKEIADHLGIHYTTVSQAIGKAAVNKKRYLKN